MKVRRQERIVLIIVFIAALFLKEEIIQLLFKTTNFLKTDQYICEIKNEEIEAKYQELVSSYGYEDSLPYKTEKSKVLFRNIYDLKDSITIYKGYEEGIQKNNLVINQDGLIGIITKVNSHTSDVMLLTNKDLNLSVKVGDAYGILAYENDQFIIKGINNKQEINEQEGVKTSDISIYPEGIFIGRVEKVELDDYLIEKKITITPSVSFDKIKYVTILTDLRGIE